MPKKLQRKIIDYYDFLWRSGQSQHYKEMLTDLPATLAIQLDVILKDKLISNAKSPAYAVRPTKIRLRVTRHIAARPAWMLHMQTMRRRDFAARFETRPVSAKLSTAS